MTNEINRKPKSIKTLVSKRNKKDLKTLQSLYNEFVKPKSLKTTAIGRDKKDLQNLYEEFTKPTNYVKKLLEEQKEKNDKNR